MDETTPYTHLSESALIKTVSETDREGVFEIESLYTGYGVTIGNALRRVLLSSLPGAAITHVKIKGVSHEFGTIPGVVEDVVEITLNLKRIRFRMHTDQAQTVTLRAKGEGPVTAAAIETNAQVDVITADLPIATVTEKGTELEMELTIERGLGYVPAESRKGEKLAIGVIALDAIFSPVVNVNFTVENMRVGDRTDYHRLRLVIGTDGSITPSRALRDASGILQEHFTKLAALEARESPPVVAVAPAPAKVKKSAAKPRRKKEAAS